MSKLYHMRINICSQSRMNARMILKVYMARPLSEARGVESLERVESVNNDARGHQCAVFKLSLNNTRLVCVHDGELSLCT